MFFEHFNNHINNFPTDGHLVWIVITGALGCLDLEPSHLHVLLFHGTVASFVTLGGFLFLLVLVLGLAFSHFLGRFMGLLTFLEFAKPIEYA